MEIDYFNKRTTIREYTQKQIPDPLLDNILEKAMHAPTCGNMQLYSVIVTKEPQRIVELAKMHYNQPAAKGANVILTFCADFKRFSDWCVASGATPGYKNFHSFIMALTDAVIYAQQVTTIAEMEGLGTCYLGTVNYNAKQIAEYLDLPELVVPVASISLGYPATETTVLSDRLPLDAIRHYETYRNDTFEKIKDFFNHKEGLADNKTFVAENKKDSLAQVFTDIRYPESINKAVSDSFTTLLKEKKFI